MKQEHALILTCLGLLTWYPLAILCHYVSTTWRLGMNERARIKRVRDAEARDAETDALIREGMRELHRRNELEKQQALRAVVERATREGNVIQFRRKV